MPVRNLRVDVAYDGTDFAGWQFQYHAVTVQGTLLQAIRHMTGEDVVMYAAGRTDAGVHALGQVCNFTTSSALSCLKFFHGLQALVPPTITILSVDEVSLKFHAQFQARRKRYRYVIDNHRHPLPFLRRFSYHARSWLDVPAMHAAGQQLLGTHDFRSFETNWPNKQSSVRTIEEVTVKRHETWPAWLPPHALAPPGLAEQTGSYVTIDVVADGFLYNMVRSIAGTLLWVGRGNWNTDDVARILRAQDRRQAGQTAPPQGLFLLHVDYDPEPGAEAQ